MPPKSGYAAVMRITEYEIYAFILGAGAGSIVTYYITTRDKRAIAEVRRYIDILGSSSALKKSWLRLRVTKQVSRTRSW